MKKLTMLSVLAVGAAVLVAAQAPGHSGGFGERGMGPMMAGPWNRTAVTGAPYSAVETREFSQTLPGGNVIQKQEQSKVSRDSEGRVRSESGNNVTIFDPVAGNSTRLDSQKLIAVQSALPPQRTGNHPAHANAAHQRGPAGATFQTEDLGTQTINGLVATGTRVTETIPAGAIGNQQPLVVTRTTWVSTELKVPVQITSSDPRFGTSTMNLTGVTREEPDAALFKVPSGYAVTTGNSWRGRAPTLQQQ
jgi:hypothetical protein